MWGGGSAGAEISPPGSLCSIERWQAFDPDGPSNLEMAIPDITANSLTTWPQFFPGTPCCVAKICHLIGGGAAGWDCRTSNTLSLSHVTFVKLGECAFGLGHLEV